jgi:protein ImuB
MLWACLFLPSLPLDVFARALSPVDATRPFAVTTGGHYPRIVAANAVARDAGIAAEQLVSAALALAPDIVLHDRDRHLETAALDGIAMWATQFTPMVSVAPPDAVLAEIGGSLRLFDGLSRLTTRLAEGACDLGYAARLTLAPTPSAALLFARADRDAASLETQTLEDALAPLPLAHLEIAPDIIAILAAAGITTFGQACALPRAALARRVGAGFVATLDRARGLAVDPRPPFVPPARYERKLDLPAPVANVDALAFATNRLTHELTGWLAGRGLGIVEMSLSLAHERYVGVKVPPERRFAPLPPRGQSALGRPGGAQTGVPATTVRIRLAAPTREPGHLIAVWRERLARVALPAPVEAITLASEVTAPLGGRNLGLLPGDEAAPTVPLIDRLRARLGEDAVTLVAPRAEHRPERASENGVRDDFSESFGGRRKVVSDPTSPPRPVWILAEPEPLGHLLEAQPWILRDGPERIESGWWDGADVRRDYFVAENPRGEAVWIFRDHRYGIDDGEWFLHGVFA